MKGNIIEVKDKPLRDVMQAFWKCIWNVNINYNNSEACMNKLKTNYCTNVNQKEYDINIETINKIKLFQKSWSRNGYLFLV